MKNGAFFKELLRKLTSRKFIAAAAAIAVGGALALGVEGDTIVQVCGAVAAAFAAVGYIAAEGKVDAASAQAVVEAARELETALREVKKNDGN